VDQFVVLASDGVWDMLPNELVCDLVTQVGGRRGRGAVAWQARLALWSCPA
jgi:serine/threonine protein phosphatase PrpC